MTPSVFTVEELAQAAADTPWDIDGEVDAIVFEDENKNEWIVWAVSPLDLKNLPDNTTVDVNDSVIIERHANMLKGHAAEHGLTKTDRTYTLAKGATFVPTHAVVTKFGTNSLAQLFGIPEYSYAMQITSSIN